MSALKNNGGPNEDEEEDQQQLSLNILVQETENHERKVIDLPNIVVYMEHSFEQESTSNLSFTRPPRIDGSKTSTSDLHCYRKQSAASS